MDDLVGGLFLLMLAVVVVAALIVVAVALVAASLVVGGIYVGAQGTWAFLSSLSRRIATRGGAERTPLPPEPAFELYALSQLGHDVKSAGRDAWSAMQSS